MLDSARAAPTIFASARGFGPAMRARGGPAVTKVFAVLFAVAIKAKRFAVAYLVAEGRMVRKGLDVMSVELYARCTAFLARIVVALKHRLAPLTELGAVSGSFIAQRRTTFPVWGFFTLHVFVGTCLATVAPIFAPMPKFLAAVFAGVLVLMAPICPALLGAEPRRIGTVLLGFVLLPAHLTGKRDAVTPRGGRALTGAVLGILAPRVIGGATLLAGFGNLKASRHRVNARSGNCYVPFDPAYCAVILERCSQAGMECEQIE